jgi:hypothetical protein
LPISSLSSLGAVAEPIAAAMADLTRSNVALLSLDARKGASEPSIVDAAFEFGTPIAGRWLSPYVALLVPAAEPRAGRTLAVLQGMLQYAQPRVGRVLADLGPLVGGNREEAMAACHLFDGVALLAMSGVTRESEILRAQRELSPERNLGTILVRGQ